MKNYLNSYSLFTLMDLLKLYFDTVVQNIKANTPPSRRAPDYDCIGMTGCDTNSVLRLERNGDFYQFTVKVLEPVKPLFTDLLIIKGLELILAEEYDSVIRLFDIKKEFISNGYDVIWYTIYKWLKLCKIEIAEFGKVHFNYYLNDLEARLYLVRSDVINVPMEIINVGANVAPSDWIGKKFKNGAELHQAIDTLDWRRGKPPVTYCCIYSMKKIDKDNTRLTKNLSKEKPNGLEDNLIIVELDSNQKAHFISKDKITKTHYVEYSNQNYQLIISFNPSEHFISEQEVKLKKYSVGLLSSTLQKSIRHGRCSINILDETIFKLARAKPYNLPEQQFLKVSGSRQLFWRLFISCIEDFRFYLDSKFINLFDILILAFITNKEPEYIINQIVIDKLRLLAKNICLADAPTDYYEWRNYKTLEPEYSSSSNQNQNIMFLSHTFMPKMSGDSIMIKKYWDMLKNYQPEPIKPNKSNYSCLKCAHGFTPKYTGVDIHSYPNMILKLQAIFRNQWTTQQISSLVWDLNSKFNNRKPKEHNNQMFNSIEIKKIWDIQKLYWNEYSNLFDIINDNLEDIPTSNQIQKPINKSIPNLSEYEKRILFLKIFGRKHRIPTTKLGERVLEVIFSYQDWLHSNKPIQIKYVNSEEYLKDKEYNSNIKRVWDYYQKTKIPVKLENCIVGYEWITCPNIKIGINQDKKPVVYHDQVTILDWFDGFPLVKPFDILNYRIPTIKNYQIIKNILGSIQTINLLDCNLECRKIINSDEKPIDIKQFKSDFNTGSNIFILKSILVKIQTAYDNIITISQVSRSGNKLDESIDYLLEGKFWAGLNLLNYCYPGALIIKGELKFYANTTHPAFSLMIRDIEYLVTSNRQIIETKQNSLLLKTKLWNHQEQTVKFIMENIIDGKKGFGDASNVGAGKTLTALVTAYSIYQMDKTINKILVLLPTEKLYKTWIDEINKHFTNLNWMAQNANGSLDSKYNPDSLNIYITTMGRNREHPLKEDWLFVIVDECLTVQNKEALQTMEAWKQVINSKHGVLLLSATFFRTRFDKLLYMLKMLNTHLPENKDYLDTILYDSIKVNLPLTKRSWTENLFKKPMENNFMENYNKINQMEISNELKYINLEKFIRENINYIKIFEEYISKITSSAPKTKLLIYATSKQEAELISSIKSVGLYPDITKTHVVVSYANGTYGLNDLVGFNHILTRPPEPDKLPQMKGRLDRPGQKESDLFISYIILANTIEEAKYLRLEICNKFYSNHIMPLSDFYTLALSVELSNENKQTKKSNLKYNDN